MPVESKQLQTYVCGRTSQSSDEPSRDVSGVERMLDASRSYFHAVVTRNVDGVLVLDDRGTIYYANPAAQSLLGSTLEELLGNTFGVRCAPGESVDVEIQRDGEDESRIVEFRVAATRWQRRPALLATIRDVSERRRAEEWHREEVRRRDEFMAMLSHELRNPLAAITNGIGFASQHVEDDTPVSEALSAAGRQCSLVNRLLDDLLDVSRFAYGRIELRHEEICLQDVVEDAVQTSHAAHAQLAAQLRVEVPEQRLYVTGDASRLVQVVVNLLGNALKYTPSDKSISLALILEQDEAVLVVDDEGCGIPASSLESIFDPFVQLSSSVDHGQAGLGMGLSLAKTILERHGGGIRATSDGPGCGSRFEARLPAIAAPSEPASTGPDVPASPAARRVLLVEDNDDLRELTAMTVSMSGHHVTPAENGFRALKLLETAEFDVALVDLGMAGMSGLELARKVRENRDWDDLELVALTGHGMPGDFEKTRDAGFDEHLVKPVDFGLLERVLSGEVVTS